MKASAVKSIRFSNYRAFKSPQELEVSPLTILFGYNNSGKSAAVRLVSLLASSFSASKPVTFNPTYIDYTAQCLRGAVFKNICYGNQGKMSFGVTWDDGQSFSFDIKQEGNENEVITSLSYKQAPELVTYIQSVHGEGKYIGDDDSGKNIS
ncbi:hypothetical protein [Pseudomonas syringae]|uniref:hypothetical protein n=1 Tax=Pseudomonas syringae TaxID=317 RepID=UPI003F777D60